MVHKRIRFPGVRITLWLSVVVISLIVLLVNYSSVVVRSVDKSSPFYGKIGRGDKIVAINDNPVRSVEDVLKYSNYTGILRITTDKGLKIARVNGTLGIDVYESSFSLSFGIDVAGGVRALLKPEKKNITLQEINDLRKRIENRINIFGLRDVKIYPIKISGTYYLQVEAVKGSISDIKELVERQGYLEAFIPVKTRKGANNTTEFFYHGRWYKIENSTKVDDIEFILLNSSSVVAKVFDSSDVKDVCLHSTASGCRAFIEMRGKNLYRFTFRVFISRKAAERIKNITEDKRVVGGRLEDGYLLLYLDKKLIDVLSIDPDLRGKLVTAPFVSGVAGTYEEAERNMKFLQTVLSSGKLPVKLSIVQIDEISPVFGARFLREIWVALLIAVVTVSIILSIRYRNPKIVVPALIFSLSEIAILLAVAKVARISLDLAGLAALIALVGSCVDSQIVIVDETRRGKSEGIKKAYSMIIASAMTTFVAMLPLLTIGAKVMQGFAIMVIIGLMIAVFITRPAFGAFVEKFIEGGRSD